jgi:hypothetical protein
MPYKKLPKTILSRKNVLDATTQKASSTAQDEWAISTQTKSKLDAGYPAYRKEVSERQSEFAKQIALSKDEDILQEILRKLVSHFWQVFNLAIERGKYIASDRTYYSLDANQHELPDIRSEKELIGWAKNFIEGEANRLAAKKDSATKLPMQNPEISEIEKALKNYLLVHNKQSAQKKKFDKENKDVLAILPKIDELILDIYDEVEFYYRRETASNKRKLASEWGIIYISSPGETPENGTITEEELYNSEIE